MTFVGKTYCCCVCNILLLCLCALIYLDSQIFDWRVISTYSVMAATSPGSRKNKSSVSSIDEVTGSPPSGLLLKVDHFGETKSATSYPTTERFING